MAADGNDPSARHQLIGGDDEINIPLGMTGETKLAVQPPHRRSDPMPAEFKWVSINSGNWTPPFQLPAAHDLQGCGEILLATNTTAVRSEQNQLGGI